MIFKGTYQEVLDGHKTQTRRIVKDGEFAENSHGYVLGGIHWNKTIDSVFSSRGYRKFTRGKIYAVQSGRGKKAIGHIQIMFIRKEKLQLISGADCKAEGIRLKQADLLKRTEEEIYRWAFMRLWNSIHPKGQRWFDNPEVWVLKFELLDCEI